jgi:hypothetical protein
MAASVWPTGKPTCLVDRGWARGPDLGMRRACCRTVVQRWQPFDSACRPFTAERRLRPKRMLARRLHRPLAQP